MSKYKNTGGGKICKRISGLRSLILQAKVLKGYEKGYILQLFKF
jgi:hypothetical protein